MEKINYEYKSEILETNKTWGLKDTVDAKELNNLNDLTNKRAQEGWELVTHTYMPNVLSTRSAILVTFRRLK